MREASSKYGELEFDSGVSRVCVGSSVAWRLSSISEGPMILTATLTDTDAPDPQLLFSLTLTVIVGSAY